MALGQTVDIDRMGTPYCAHTGKPIVRQQSLDDCMACSLAMFGGRTYEELTAAAQAIQPDYTPGGFMSHSLLRRIAHNWGMPLVSSIYMDWRYPGIVGVISKTIENCGHALFWDGEQLIDPGVSATYDLDYVTSHGIEFSQRAIDVAAVVDFARQLAPATAAATPQEFF